MVLEGLFGAKNEVPNHNRTTNNNEKGSEFTYLGQHT